MALRVGSVTTSLSTTNFSLCDSSSHSQTKTAIVWEMICKWTECSKPAPCAVALFSTPGYADVHCFLHHWQWAFDSIGTTLLSRVWFQDMLCLAKMRILFRDIYVTVWIDFDHLCGLVVRVSGYRYRGLGFDSRRYQIFWVVVGLKQGPLSLMRSIEELLE